MAVNVQRYVTIHKSRKAKRTRVATAAGSLSLAALLAVSWGLKYIGFSLTNNQPFSLNSTVTRLDNPNPDTSVVGDNFYRQYLNIEGKEEATPIDLLLLVDQSGSMAQNKDFTFGESLGYRDVILSSFLNGEANANYRENPEISDLDQYVIESIANEDGFVNQFLGINPDNKIAIIGLNTVSDSTISDGYTAYENAQVILDWTSDPLSDKGVDVTAQYESGTDYAAGLMLANEMLGSDKVTKDGHKKVLIVIGDGEPTCYTDLEGNVISFIAPSVEDNLEVTVVPEDITETDETAVIEETTESTEVIENNNSEVTEPTTTDTEATVETTVEEAVETDVTEATEETQITDETIPSETTEEVVVETEETEPTIEETEVTEPEITEATESTEATEIIDETEPSETSSEEVAETDVTEYVEETQVTESAVVEETSETEPSMDMAVVTEETIETAIQEEERDLFKGIKKISKEETDVVVTEDVVITESEEAAEEVTVAPQISSVDMDAYKSECNKATLDAFKALIENNEDLVVYSIGLSEDLKLTSLEENAEKFVITQLISESGEYIYVENNVDKLSRDIFNLLEKDMPNGVVVTAELSNYVQIVPMESSEIKVTMTDEDGNVTVLYDEVNGGITEAGKYIVEDVVIVEPEEGETDTNGSVNLVFKPQYVLNEGVTYTLSYNVFLTSGAYEMYLSEGYTDKGDKNTDFDSDSKVSSSKKGFYINRDAYVTYVLNGNRVGYNVEEGLNVFNRPVVQVDEDVTTEEIEALIEFEAVDYQVSGSFPVMNYTITGNAQTPDSKVVLNKNIDSLGDDEPNPDTTLTGSEFYRLYLDIEGHDQSTPVDLLIVVDQSGSMFDNKDVTLNNQTVYRDVAVSAILNGSASTSRPGNPGSAETLANNKDSYWVQANATDEGLINEFLSLNEKNKVCVIGFDAWRDSSEGGIRYSDKECTKQDNSNGQYMYYHGYASKGWSYQEDSTVITPWEGGNGWISGSLQNPVDVTGKWNTGTNYAAGFRLAQDMLTQQNIRNDGNQKVMIFISDGVPTCYIGSNGDRQGSTTSTLYNSSTPNEYNILQCRQPSVDAFNNLIGTLHNEGIDVKAYSVGVSAELGNPDPNHPYSSEAIRQCNANGGDYIYVDKDGDLLHKKLYEIINYTVPSQVVIRDQLSQYVEYYDQQPDVKVMMSKIGSNEAPVVLYQNGTVTNAGKNIIQTVTYTPVKGDDTTTGTIEAKFDPTYALEPGYKYSLSYNVKLTETSYNEFVDGGYNATGGTATDYGSNTTSQNQGGFKSNKEAEVDFHFYGDEKTGTYDHPVVQVDKTDYFTDVTVVKNWEDDNGPIKPVEPVEVQLWQVGTPASGVSVGDTDFPGSTITSYSTTQSITEDFSSKTWSNITSKWNGSFSKFGNPDITLQNGIATINKTANYESFSLNLNNTSNRNNTYNYAGKTILIETSVKSDSGHVHLTLNYPTEVYANHLNPDGREYCPDMLVIDDCKNQFRSGSTIIHVPENASGFKVYLEGDSGTDPIQVDYFNVSIVNSVSTYTPPHDNAVTDNVIYENFMNNSAGNFSNRGTATLNVIPVDGNPANQVLEITNRDNGEHTDRNWVGAQINVNKFIGKEIVVSASAMAYGNNGEIVELGIQFNDPNYTDQNGGHTRYESLVTLSDSNSKFDTGVSNPFKIPANASDCYIFIQSSKNIRPMYIDYVYIKEYSPAEPSLIEYRDPVTLSKTNENKFTFENLPLWGLDSAGNRMDYSYYIVENIDGKNYTVTYSVDSSTPVTDGTITVTNKVPGVFGYELPTTGGIGTGFNYFIGFILICIPGGFYIRRIQKRSVRDP